MAELTQARRDANRLYRQETNQRERYHRAIEQINCLECYCVTAQGLSLYEATIFTAKISDIQQMITTATANIFSMEAANLEEKSGALRPRVDDLQTLHDYRVFEREVKLVNGYAIGNLDLLKDIEPFLSTAEITSSVFRGALNTPSNSIPQLRAYIIREMHTFVETQCYLIDAQRTDEEVQGAIRALDEAVGYFDEGRSVEGALLRQALFENGVQTIHFEGSGWQTMLNDASDLAPLERTSPQESGDPMDESNIE